MNDLCIDFDVPVPMRDGTILRANVYRPTEGTWPGLLTRTPYSKSLIPALLPSLDPVRVARDGYVVAIQDTRGRFGSEGTFAPFDEGDDGYDTIAWLASTPWCDGRVGMYGSSYMAATQLQAAVKQPPALRAIVPVHGSSDYYEGRSYQGGAFELGGLTTIAMWALARGSIQRDPSLNYGAELGEVRRALADLDGFLSTVPLDALRETVLMRAAPFFFDWATHTTDDPYWRALSLEHRHGEINTAGLHITSWFDQYHVGTLRNFEGITRDAISDGVRDSQALLIGPWAHYVPKTTVIGAARVGDVDFGLDALIDLEGLQLRWFAEHLRGETGAWRQRSPVRLFVMGENAWRDEDSWPVQGASTRPLYLTADRRLDWRAPTSSPPVRFDFDPVKPVSTKGGAHLVFESVYPSGPLNHQHLEDRQDVVVFTSAPLDEDIEIIGWVDAALHVRTSAVSTDFTVKLLDVWPDGRILNIVDGIKRINVDAQVERSGWIRADVKLGATAILVRRGHSLQVHVSSSNFPRFDVNPNTGESAFTARRTVVAHQQICIGGNNASAVLLPVRRTAR